MIFTFYSYKGGVGRSMALANVAEWLYLQGLRVGHDRLGPGSAGAGKLPFTIGQKTLKTWN